MTQHSVHEHTAGMSRGLILLFAVATGQAVTSNYLAQPLLATIRNELGISTGVAGLIVTTAQVGYAAGLILLLPLGDLLERRRLITGLALITAAGFVLLLTPSIGLLMAAVGAVGFTSVMAQILVPFAATLAPEAERGRVVGTVISGLLVGILVARTFSGLVAEIHRLAHGLRSGRPADGGAGRAPVGAAAEYHESAGLRYPRLLASVLQIARAEPLLRRRAFYGMLSFASFSVLWTTLAFLLAGPQYGYSEGTIGLFGLVGAAGALTATVAGRFDDRGWARSVTGVSAALLVVGSLLLWLGATSLAALLAGVDHAPRPGDHQGGRLPRGALRVRFGSASSLEVS